jgi:hypothetical protein
MTRCRLSVTIATILSVASATAVLAQTPPQQDQAEPKAASSPHQRETTETKSQEAPTSAETSPASASSPHQRETTQETTEGKKMASAKGKKDRERMMSECMDKQKQMSSSMSTQEMKKTCEEQMKSHSETMKE